MEHSSENNMGLLYQIVNSSRTTSLLWSEGSPIDSINYTIGPTISTSQEVKTKIIKVTKENFNQVKDIIVEQLINQILNKVKSKIIKLK